MQRMFKSVSRSASSILLLVVIIATIVLFARVVALGRGHVEAGSYIRLASEDWQKGEYLDAIVQYLQATKLILEGGLRHMIALPFIEQISPNERDGNLREALSNCAEAVRILGNYDDEGSLGERCFELETRINAQTPTPQSP